MQAFFQVCQCHQDTKTETYSRVKRYIVHSCSSAGTARCWQRLKSQVGYWGSRYVALMLAHWVTAGWEMCRLNLHFFSFFFLFKLVVKNRLALSPRVSFILKWVFGFLLGASWMCSDEVGLIQFTPPSLSALISIRETVQNVWTPRTKSEPKVTMERHT